MNRERTIVTLLREISKENGFEFHTYSYDWVKELIADGKSMYINGYNFPLNNSSFTLIANDKACTSEILSAKGIPNVEHSYFMSPNDIHYVRYLGVDGNWSEMLTLLEKHGKVIVKPNSGTGGMDLHIADCREKLEKAVNDIFSKTTTLSICPYYEIESEHRVIMLNGDAKLVFKKVRPYIIGNGQDTVGVLCAKKGKYPDKDCGIDFNYVPQNNEQIEIGWKHNLGQGSIPEILSEGNTYNEVCKLAKETLSVLGGTFASVDCVCIDGKYRVLEVNSGVMMDNFALSGPTNYIKAKSIYLEAINNYFNKHKYQ